MAGDARTAAMETGLAQEAAELAAGKATLGKMVFFPQTVAVLFGLLFLMRKKLEDRRVPQEHEAVEIV
jgi:hypothetical protein